MSNVIEFPSHRIINKSNLTLEDVKSNIEDVKHFHVYETISTIIPSIIQQMSLAGFEVDDDNELSVRDGAFLVEAMKSMLFRHYDIEHPFQKLAEEILNDDSGEGFYEIISQDSTVDTQSSVDTDPES